MNESVLQIKIQRENTEEGREREKDKNTSLYQL